MTAVDAPVDTSAATLRSDYPAQPPFARTPAVQFPPKVEPYQQLDSPRFMFAMPNVNLIFNWTWRFQRTPARVGGGEGKRKGKFICSWEIIKITENGKSEIVRGYKDLPKTEVFTKYPAQVHKVYRCFPLDRLLWLDEVYKASQVEELPTW